ncbi:MAG: fasciclin domain-containing protein [Bacteroidota bacterium]
MKIQTLSMFLVMLSLTFMVSAQENISYGHSKTEANPKKTIIKYAEGSQNLSTLLAAIKAVDIDVIMGNEGPYTVFAPSDKAFEKYQGAAELFDPENKKDLRALITYHIIAGKLTASSILRAMCRGNGMATFTTVQGNKIKASMNGLDIILTDYLGNSAKITTADMDQRNGVIHQIDSVIFPRKM